MKIYVVDNGGQWTHREWKVLRKLEVDSEIVQNNVDTSVLEGASGIVLSGGAPSIVDEMDKLGIIGKYIDSLNLPVFGICIGAQFIALHFGGKVGRAKVPEFGKADLSFFDQGGIFKDIPNKTMAWENHNDEIIELPDNFVLCASSKNCKVQAFYHRERPIYGVQFHPEVQNTEFGKNMFENFINVCGKGRR
ncbi:GMP synthase subunit A [mine drainage metagenome]|uniref:GMP synthase subunit A n=1 Tax=mine drainage metagenome TaxID=410659 RepID=T1ADJ0_9ZZZZ